MTEKEVVSQQTLDMHHDMLSRACRRYWENLNASIRGRSYLKKRGINAETIARFGIGYAEEAKQGLRTVFPNYHVQSLVDCGLVVEKSHGRVDRFRDRIMVPILNETGRVIGFGGRIIDGERPKYLNSPETPLFRKRQELFGIPQARQAITETGTICIVEGYMDVVSLSQHGIENVVATLGTATTVHHVEKLALLAKHAVFCFDGDAAGHAAAVKAMHAVAGSIGEAFSAAFAFLPAGDDPDNYVRKHGTDAFQQRMSGALPFEAFVLRYLRHGKNLETSEGRAALAGESLDLLNAIRDAGLFYRLVEAVARAAHYTVAEILSFCDPEVERSWAKDRLSVVRLQVKTV